MNIQIFGIPKCFDTKKAQRYFKERKIKFQFVDLLEKGLSKGELDSIEAAVGLEKLINKEIKDYERLNLSKIGSSTIKKEILLKNPKLYNTPIVRNGKQATVGYTPDVWETWE
ncbi:MAG: ArsC family transcriptional regulator [Clostridiales bacterium GWB2_37_7]|nr:MAG: ArsC family transcriptional regulator [Clostridiales bacterium GWB2_37_7]